MDNPCEWCCGTDSLIDSQAYQIEQLRSRIAELEREASDVDYVMRNLEKQLVKRLLPKDRG
jgi:hypothetical protein